MAVSDKDRVLIGAASTEKELSNWVAAARHIADHTAPDVRVKALRDAVLAFYDACKFSNVQINHAERDTLTRTLTMLDNLYDDTFAQLYRTPPAPPPPRGFA